MLGGRADLLHPVGLPGFGDVPVEQVRQADDGVHRGADFMAHVGQEGAFGPVGALCFVPCGGQFEGALGHQFFKVVAVLLQFGVELPAIGDVADQAHHIGLAAPLHLARLDLCRIGAAVLASMNGLEGFALGSDRDDYFLHLLRGVERFPVPYVQLDQLLRRVAEQRGKLRVGFKDAAVVIEHDDAVAIHFKQGTAARSLLDDRLLGLLSGQVLGMQGVKQFVEVTSQLGDLVGFGIGGDACRVIAAVNGLHGVGDLRQPPGEVTGAPQEGEGQGEHAQGQEACHAGGQQPFFVLQLFFRETDAHHADALPVAIDNGIVTGDLLAIQHVRASHPGVSLVDDLFADGRQRPCSDGAQAVFPGHRGADPKVVEKDRHHPAAFAEAGIDREDHVTDAVQHREVVVEQHAADENGVGVGVGQCEMRCRIDEQAACLELCVVFVAGWLVAVDVRAIGQIG